VAVCYLGHKASSTCLHE